jgi:hypothetical protein
MFPASFRLFTQVVCMQRLRARNRRAGRSGGLSGRGTSVYHGRRMARGWESKAVESQQEDAGRTRRMEPALSDEARHRLQQRRTLELALAQTQAELGAACRAAHRDMLRQRLEAIKAAIAALS